MVFADSLGHEVESGSRHPHYSSFCHQHVSLGWTRSLVRSGASNLQHRCWVIINLFQMIALAVWGFLSRDPLVGKRAAARGSNYNPHVHVMVTGGGVNEAGQWQAVKTVSYDFLYREWQLQLFAMLEAQVRDSTMTTLSDSLRQEVARGLVAYWELKPVKTGKRLARNLIKYVASPPIAVSRIIDYDGQEVEYYWQDHKSHQPQRATVWAVKFIRRLVQHILPEGFQRVRYDGLYAVCLRQKVMKQIRKAIGAALQLAFSCAEAVVTKLGWQAKIKRKFGRDPMRCERCGEEMLLWMVWTPTRWVVCCFPNDASDWVEEKASSEEKEVVDAQSQFLGSV